MLGTPKPSPATLPGSRPLPQQQHCLKKHQVNNSLWLSLTRTGTLVLLGFPISDFAALNSKRKRGGNHSLVWFCRQAGKCHKCNIRKVVNEPGNNKKLQDKRRSIGNRLVKSTRKRNKRAMSLLKCPVYRAKFLGASRL